MVIRPGTRSVMGGAYKLFFRNEISMSLLVIFKCGMGGGASAPLLNLPLKSHPINFWILKCIFPNYLSKMKLTNDL